MTVYVAVNEVEVVQGWDNLYAPPSADTGWYLRTVGTTLPQTGVPFHQQEYPPVGGGTQPTYEVEDYPEGCELLLVGDGTTLDMPLYLPKRVKRLHVRGVRMILDVNKSYLTSKNDNSGTYHVARAKGPFHVNFTHSLVMEGCYIDASGISFDIVQLPRTTTLAQDHATRDVYLLNSQFRRWGGVSPGFHGDLFHSANNSCRDVYVENVGTDGQYNDWTTYPWEGVAPVRQLRMRNVTHLNGGTNLDGEGNKAGNFALVGHDNTPIMDNVFHNWGSYVDPDGVGHTLPGLRNTNPGTLDDVADSTMLGAGYSSPFNIGAVIVETPDTSGTVTGGDGTVGILEGHNTSNAIITQGAANGYGLYQTSTTNGVIIDNTIPHPNPNRSDVYRFRWEVGVPQIGGGNRSEGGRYVGPAGGASYRESTGTFYYALGVYAESGKYPDPQTWRILAQFHNGGGYSPPVSINLRGETGRLQMVNNLPSGSNQKWVDTVQFPRDEWMYLVWRVVWSQNGRVDFWRMRKDQDTAFVYVGGGNGDTTGGLTCDGRQGIYTEDIANADVEIRMTNTVRGTGFGAVVQELTGLTVGGSSSSPAPPSSVTSADPGTWALVFEDNFETFDYAKWAKSGEAHPTTGFVWTDLYPGFDPHMHGWLPENVYVSGGQLHLRITKVGSEWYGGMVHQFKISNTGWKYGYFEVRFKPPPAVKNGFTAPFWMLPQFPRQYWSGGGDEALGTALGVPWPDSGEIDVVEQFFRNLPDEAEIAYSNATSRQNGVLTEVEFDDYRTIGEALEDDYHSFGCHWFADPANSNKITIRMLHDGVEYGRNTQDLWGGEYSATAPYDQPFYFLMGIHGGIGYGEPEDDAGNGVGWPADEWHNSEILIDRVRVFQRV